MSPPTCRRVVLAFGLIVLLNFFPVTRAEAAAPPAKDAATVEERVANLESQFTTLKQAVEKAAGPSLMALFLCAAFCALWAQNTYRNPWLWYFLGLFFNFFTLFVVLWKNSKDKQWRRPAKPKEEAEFREPACV
jgi:hypothetical protein